MDGIDERKERSMNAGEQVQVNLRVDVLAGADARPKKVEEPVILVVDDDERNLFAMAESLRDIGQVMVAHSGAEALKQLLNHDFAVILLDVLMPGIDGYETASLIRAREYTRHVPIIFLTAINKDDSHMLHGYAMGAVDYVFKPVDTNVLRSKVTVFVELFNKSREIQRKAEEQQRLLEENLRIRTEKLLAEQALRRSEERQGLIVQSLPLVLYASILDSKGTVSHQYVSDNVENVCGFPARSFLRGEISWVDRIHPEDRERVLQQLSDLREGRSVAREYRWQHANGQYRVFLDQAVPAVDEKTTLIEIVGTALDVTDQRQLEQQFVQAQKMDAIGKLTGGIAHDFNNMLTVVISCLDHLKRSYQGDPAPLRRIDLALAGALRCSDLTRQLLTFAGRQSLKPERMDLNELVRHIGDMVLRIVGDHIQLQIDCDSSACLVEVDRTQAESALLNLVVNARDAMPDGGTLTISTSAGIVEGRPDVALVVRDSGVGIAKEHIGRVFEPFFTTKEPGKGTGLGLSIIYGFVKESGGNVTIDSEVGRGTSVAIHLPRATGDIDAQRPAAKPALNARAKPGEAVLIVEDDKAVCEVAVGALSELGYQVTTAANAVQALDMLASGTSAGLVFTDVMMPGGMTGYDLAHKLQTLRPELKVLVTSAHVEQLTSDAVPHSVVGFLHKPYRQDDLAVAIRRAFNIDAVE